MDIRSLVKQGIIDDAINGKATNRILGMPKNVPGKPTSGEIKKLPAYYKTIAEYEMNFKKEYMKELNIALKEVNKILLSNK